MLDITENIHAIEQETGKRPNGLLFCSISEKVITHTSHFISEYTGYSCEEMTGMSIFQLLGKGEEYLFTNAGAEIAETGTFTTETMIRNNNGTETPAEVTIIEMPPDVSRQYLIIVRDLSHNIPNDDALEKRSNALRDANRMLKDEITQRRISEDQLRKSLAEKNLLLREVHHRVKNNLQVILSMLDLRGMRTRDLLASAILSDARSKIYSISLIHSLLYKSEDLVNINLCFVVKELISFLFDVYDVNYSKTELTIDIEDISLDISVAIPCTLIMNELFSNVIKHTFTPDQDYCTRRAGSLFVKASIDGAGLIALSIRDKGAGLPPDIDVLNTNTLGLKLVHTLVIDQLRGSLALSREQGTEFTITFRGGNTVGAHTDCR